MSRFVVPANDLATAITLSSPIDRKSPGTAMVWDLTGARKLGEVETEPGRYGMPAAVVTPKGSKLVVGGVLPIIERGMQKTTITTCDMKTGKKLNQAEVPPGNSQMELAAADENTVLVSDGRASCGGWTSAAAPSARNSSRRMWGPSCRVRSRSTRTARDSRSA